ncbi:MAG: tRNA (N6-threonylcarbamoyladenosine(37)-N6)-methyltransferase TrmO [Bacteroidia bacterium]|nr:tRNA (N6-threonylcarbamoyladenosine(37)-N6)-methyltransferase TrmO [Bacteroidia bacterium]
MEISPIAFLSSPLTSKFGVPKQSGLVSRLICKIVFEPCYRNADYLRGMEGYDFLWLIWGFSANKHKANSPVVRPPVLGGNEKMGVFATRSPFRPNPLALSSVKIEHIDYQEPAIFVSGADLMDGTPIYDIKPYLPFTDAHPEARGGFSAERGIKRLEVCFDCNCPPSFSPEEIAVISDILSHDPRPQYISDSADRVYGMPYNNYDIRFSVSENTIHVVEIATLKH